LPSRPSVQIPAGPLPAARISRISGRSAPVDQASRTQSHLVKPVKAGIHDQAGEMLREMVEIASLRIFNAVGVHF
jgi:hypothetical protein